MFISKSKINKFGLNKIKSILMLTNNRCCYCGVKLKKFDPTAPVASTADFFTVEHIVPLSQGGGNAKSNILAACRSCNEIRGNHNVEFLRMKLLFGQNNWPRFTINQFNFLYNKGILLSRLGKYIFFYEQIKSNHVKSIKK